jgi:hypothetical protein
MLHACVERFDVMGGRGNILGWEGEVNKALFSFVHFPIICNIGRSSYFLETKQDDALSSKQ